MIRVGIRVFGVVLLIYSGALFRDGRIVSATLLCLFGSILSLGKLVIDSERAR